MEGWMYFVIAVGVTAVPAVGLSLLARPEEEHDEDQVRPRWSRAKNAMRAALGGAAAVASIPKKRAAAGADPELAEQD